MTLITALPTPPSTSDPANFDARADAFLGAFPTLEDEINALPAIFAAFFVTTSSTSVAVGTGSKTFTVEPDKAYAAGTFVTITSTASPANYMLGRVTDYTGTTLTVNVTTTGGSGTIAAWTISISGLPGGITGGALTSALDLAPSVTVASASTCDIGAAASNNVIISGTTTITSFGTGTNKLRIVRFAAALTLTYNATSLILPGAANLVTEANDTAVFTSDTSGNWRLRHYMRAASRFEGGYGPTQTVGVSAGVLDVGAYASHFITAGGSIANITSLGSNGSLASPIYRVRFNTPHTLVHNATSLILPGGMNITPIIGDVLTFEYLGSGNWRLQQPDSRFNIVDLGTIADDAVATVPLATDGAMVLVVPNNAAASAAQAVLWVRSNATLGISKLVSTGVTIGTYTTTLGGTTGTDTQLNIGVSGGVLYIENRSGAGRAYRLFIFRGD